MNYYQQAVKQKETSWADRVSRRLLSLDEPDVSTILVVWHMGEEEVEGGSTAAL